MLPEPAAPAVRVLLGPLPPLVRAGLTALLHEDGLDLVGTEQRPHALLLMAARVRPDVVVADLRDAASRRLADRVRAAAPESKVILLSPDEDVMEVIDGAETRRFLEDVPEELRHELRTAAAQPARRR